MNWRIVLLLPWAAAVSALTLRLDLQLSDGESMPQTPMLNTPVDDPDVPETPIISADAELPTVDLGYTKHRAVANPNPKLYKFQNIRYAAAPVGDLRFKAPQPAYINHGQAEDGIGRKECPQAIVKWGENFPDDNPACADCECCQEENDDGSCRTPCSDQQRAAKVPKSPFGGLLPDLTDPSLFSEDCLFLDVWSPKTAFNNDFMKFPVLVWIYGGAYVFGGKSLYFPGGRMSRVDALKGGNMNFVAMNYRMGALGFAAGKDIADDDVNAGLLDQQQALRWVQEHIEKFGGDPNQVTIAGLSAGGGSVIHHLTSFGGDGEQLFNRAVSLSGGWQPITNKTTAEDTFQEFMEIAGAKDLDELRKIPEDKIMKANFDQINKAPPGTFLYNPTAWGSFAPESPSKLLLESKYRQNVDVILSNVADEGGKFTGAFAEKNTTVQEFVGLALPDLSEKEREFVLETYSTDEVDAVDIGRIIADSTFRCHSTYVSDAKDGSVYRQRWNTFKSSGHGGDLFSLFYQPGVPVESIRSARILQDYVVSFTLFGAPSTVVKNPLGAQQPIPYNKYDSDGKIQYLDSGLFKIPQIHRGDAELEDICHTWQRFKST